MELREPPRPSPLPATDPLVRGLLGATLLLLVALIGLVLLESGTNGPPISGDQRRELAGKLKAAGLLDEAATLYEDYLSRAEGTAESRARIAYSLGTSYLDRGQFEKALRWFYEAESLGVGDLSGELGAKIVHTLERLGRHHAAQAALDARVRLDAEPGRHPRADPIVARVGQTEIRRSEVDRALDDLPPDIAQGVSTPKAREEFLKKLVADELLWRKATKLEYHQDPEVLRQQAALLKQLAVRRFVEQEILGKIEVDEADLRTFFEANRSRYDAPQAAGQVTQPRSFDELRPLVERHYRLFKMQAAYNTLIESELETAEVELYPERLADDG